MIPMILNYFKITLKVLLRRKFFTFVSIFGISFTLIVLLTVTALYENSYSPRQPESNSDRFLTFTHARFTDTRRPGHQWSGDLGYKFFDQYARKLPHMEALSIHSSPQMVVAFSKGRKLDIVFKFTDGAFWQTMNFKFLEGGPFSERDNENQNFVAVINEATRDQYFGEEKVVGKEIKVDGNAYRVIGVVANVPEYRPSSYADVWVPIHTKPSDSYRETVMGDFMGTILVTSKAHIPKIKAALRNIVAEIPSPRPEDYDTFETFADTHMEVWARQTGGWSTRWDEDAGKTQLLWTVVGLGLLFMLLPAINLININISRIMERAGEIGVRKAFGATSATLTIQFLIENLILTLFGALLSLIGVWGVLSFINQSGFIPYAQLTLNWQVFAAAVFFAMIFGTLSGVYPAWRMSKTHPASALKGGRR